MIDQLVPGLDRSHSAYDFQSQPNAPAFSRWSFSCRDAKVLQRL